ncbi:hypothetical protein ACEPAG_3556 [Sanghuangporus baumii]
MDVAMNQARARRACYKCGKVGHFIRDCPRGREAIRSIIAAFEPEDRLALLEELGNAKESDFEGIDVRAVPAELEEIVDDANIRGGFNLRNVLSDVIPNESEDDDDFGVYDELFVRRVSAQGGDSDALRADERIQTAIKNEVVTGGPYRENVVAQANDTEAVWDVVGRRVADVWREGIEDAMCGQFIRRSGGQELDAFVSIVHPQVASDDEVDALNPMKQDEYLIDAHALIDSGCTGSCIDEGFVRRYGFRTQKYIRPRPVFNADGTSNESGLIKEYVIVRMIFGKHEEEIRLAVTSLASSNIFLGHDWLRKHNPEIDWKIGKIDFTRCPDECASTLSNEEADDDYVRRVWMKEATKWPSYLEEFADVFSEESFEQLPDHRTWDHAIDLKPDFKPSDCKVYPLSPKEQEAMKAFIEENLASGRIRQSKSPMASPFFFIKKEDGSLRAIQDYRKLNDGTVKNKYPLPLINELIDKVKDAKYITKLDVRWGYYNIRIRKGDEWKAAFRTNLGLFEPTVMFFGLCNAPATFQGFMNNIFRELIHEGVVIIYLDDILIFSNTLEEHRERTRRVFEILRKNKLFLKPQKCEFEVSTVKYLGHIIGNGEVRMDPKKTIAVQEWPVPKNVHELQQFLGLGNWLRRFVEGYSSVVKPLTSLTGKAEWKWGEEEQRAFEELKERLSSPPVLAIPNNDDPFRVEADASDFATGGVLLQKQEGKWKVIAYRSSTLLDAERNYEIYDKEMLAIVQALKEWRQYLQGANQPFEVWTDHANLTYFKAPQKLNRRQARWRLDLAEFDFTLVHKPGKTLGKADLLSRRADYDKGEHDNENVTFIKNECLVRATVNTSRDSLVETIKKAQEDMDDGEKPSGLVLKDGVWSKEVTVKVSMTNSKKFWNVFVPTSVREAVMKECHDSTLAGHPGANKTVSMVSRSYWWPNMYVDVRNYVRGCDHCQRTKALRVTRAKVLHPNEVPEAPWQIVTVDLIGELPESNGFNAICVVVDRFSKQIHAIPTTTKLTAEGMARIYRDHVFRLHGLPKKIIHDRGVQFDAKMMKELYKLLHIEELEQYLRLYVNHRQSDWADWLALAEFAHNNREHSATKLSPFFVNSGVHPVGFTGIRTSSSNMSAEEFAKHVKGIHELAQANLVKANEDMKRFYDRHAGKLMEYETGSKVFLDGRNIKTIRPTKKMDDKWFGPFEIIGKVGASAYRLKLPRTWRQVHPVFNEVLLKPAVEPSFESQKKPPPPPPVLVDDEEEYEVKELLDSRLHRGKLQFLVKWVGYNEATWQPESDIGDNAKEASLRAIRKFTTSEGYSGWSGRPTLKGG